jgi:uncharacterized protein (TIGR03000 family)
MRKLFLVAVVAASLLLDNGTASALGHRRGCGGGCDSGCGGGRHHRVRHHRGCGGGGGCASACDGCGAAAGCGTACCMADPAGAAYAMATGGIIDGYADYVVDDASAIMVVDLPTDATLKVDDTVTTSTSSNRVFVTPPLESGKSYQYTLTAQVMQDGVLQTVTRQVTVRAGEEVRVNLELPAATVVSQ